MSNLYKGKYSIFNTSGAQNYFLKNRTSRVRICDIIDPQSVIETKQNLKKETANVIDIISSEIISARKSSKPVILFTGAHLVKNGLGRLVIDLVLKKMLTLVAGNAATSIHDFELALFGQTSENTFQALIEHKFGMALEFGYINQAIILGNEYKLGFGESIGKFICEDNFRKKALANFCKKMGCIDLVKFLYPQFSIAATCYKNNIPFTIHASIGTDVIDQHKNFNGEAKGGCSARDFLIYTNEVSKLGSSGVVLNIGSAVTGPEVLLKAVSMTANAGSPPDGIVTADFDLRDEGLDKMTDESSQFYYFRDQKSIVTRIPKAFNGKGYYIQGDLKITVPCLYRKIIEKLKK